MYIRIIVIIKHINLSVCTVNWNISKNVLYFTHYDFNHRHCCWLIFFNLIFWQKWISLQKKKTNLMINVRLRFNWKYYFKRNSFVNVFTARWKQKIVIFEKRVYLELFKGIHIATQFYKYIHNGMTLVKM